MAHQGIILEEMEKLKERILGAGFAQDVVERTLSEIDEAARGLRGKVEKEIDDVTVRYVVDFCDLETNAARRELRRRLLGG